MEHKKYAVLLYPKFSLQEITCLTSCLSVWFGEELEMLASKREPVESEEGFCVIPAKTVEEAHVSDYACVILPGTIDPLPALYDDKLIDFLRQGRETKLCLRQSPPHRCCCPRQEFWRVRTSRRDTSCR